MPAAGLAATRRAARGWLRRGGPRWQANAGGGDRGAGSFGVEEAKAWSRRQESNLYLALRRRSFYPLNYGEGQSCQDRRSAGLR